jgi:hypothetical protein
MSSYGFGLKAKERCRKIVHGIDSFEGLEKPSPVLDAVFWLALLGCAIAPWVLS